MTRVFVSASALFAVVCAARIDECGVAIGEVAAGHLIRRVIAPVISMKSDWEAHPRVRVIDSPDLFLTRRAAAMARPPTACIVAYLSQLLTKHFSMSLILMFDIDLPRGVGSILAI